MTQYRVIIEMDLGDAACLPGTIERVLGEQERHMRIAGHLYSEEDTAYGKRYLEQLRNCLAAIRTAMPQAR